MCFYRVHRMENSRLEQVVVVATEAAETGVVEPACRVVNSSSTDPACLQVVISLTSRESAVRNAYRSPLSVTLARTRIS